MRSRLLLCLLLAAGCGGTANFAGNYNVGITNQDNGCGFDNWKNGEVTGNIPFTITQSADRINGQIGGLVGAYVNALIGSNTFIGNGSGNELNLTLTGMRAGSKGSCAYTINAVVTGTLNGDALSGGIDYQALTNNTPDCGTLTGCHSHQIFSGIRPAVQ